MADASIATVDPQAPGLAFQLGHRGARERAARAFPVLDIRHRAAVQQRVELLVAPSQHGQARRGHVRLRSTLGLGGFNEIAREQRALCREQMQRGMHRSGMRPTQTLLQAPDLGRVQDAATQQQDARVLAVERERHGLVGGVAARATQPRKHAGEAACLQAQLDRRQRRRHGDGFVARAQERSQLAHGARVVAAFVCGQATYEMRRVGGERVLSATRGHQLQGLFDPTGLHVLQRLDQLGRQQTLRPGPHDRHGVSPLWGNRAFEDIRCARRRVRPWRTQRTTTIFSLTCSRPCRTTAK